MDYQCRCEIEMTIVNGVLDDGVSVSSGAIHTRDPNSRLKTPKQCIALSGGVGAKPKAMMPRDKLIGHNCSYHLGLSLRLMGRNSKGGLHKEIGV